MAEKREFKNKRKCQKLLKREKLYAKITTLQYAAGHKASEKEKGKGNLEKKK